MTYVERVLVLRNGPPWGFRLYEDFMEGLVVSKIRRRSPAELAGMREGDHVLAISGIDALDMSHARAVQIIDFASYTLEVVVGRYEKMQRVETVYLDNQTLRARQAPQEMTTTELQLFWEKTPLKPVRTVWNPPQYEAPPPPQPPPQPRPTPQPVWLPVQPPRPVKQPSPPPMKIIQPVRRPSPEPENVIIPHDPDVSRVSVQQLMREFDAPPIAPELKKKNYADSSFYSDPARYYPTIEEQIEMARRVADSLHDPDNYHSRGANMFEKQRIRADKHVKEGPEPEPDPIESASPEELERMEPPTPPPPPPPPPPSFPGLQPNRKPAIPTPPPMPAPGQPKTVQEFLEKIKIFPKNSHADLDPQKCFDIASALYTSDSRGAKMFARRHARAKKWDTQADEEEEGQHVAPQPMIAAAPGPTIDHQARFKAMSRLPQSKPQPTFNPVPNQVSVVQQNQMSEEPRRPSISLAAARSPSPPKPEENLADGMPVPFMYSNSDVSENRNQMVFGGSDQSSVTSKEEKSSGWRPVKFKIGQAAA